MEDEAVGSKAIRCVTYQWKEVVKVHQSDLKVLVMQASLGRASNTQ